MEIWSLLTLCAAGGNAAGERTALGRALSGPVCAMVLGAILSNAHGARTHPPHRRGSTFISLIARPFQLTDDSNRLKRQSSRRRGAHYAAVQSLVVALATPLLLLGADLRVVFEDTKRLTRAFAVGSAATAVGAVVGFAAAHSWLSSSGVAGALGPDDGYKVAAALAAKSIGGGLNYVAVASALGVSASAMSAGIVADNVFALVYFPVVAALAGDGERDGFEREDETSIVAPPPPPAVDVGQMLAALALACVVSTASSRVAPPSLGALPTATAFTVLFATLAPRRVAAYLAPAGDLVGNAALYVFFASAGAAGESVSQIFSTPALFLYLGVLYACHLAIVWFAGHKGLGIAKAEALIGSNACVGGPATAAALARSKGWRALVAPGILVGNLGNAVGTFAGLALAAGFRVWTRGGG